MIELLTQASADMASALGKDVGNVAQSLGRYVAMGSRGMSMLERQGVLFTNELKEQVKALEEQGKLEEAKLMMAEFVADTYKGQAEAIANTSFGQWEQFKNILGDVKEGFGKIIADNLSPFLKLARKIMEWINGWGDGVKKLATFVGVAITAFTGLSSAVIGVRTALTLLNTLAGGFSAKMALATGGISLALGAIALGIQYAAENWDSFSLNMIEGWIRIKEAMRPVAEMLLQMWNLWVDLVRKTPAGAGMRVASLVSGVKMPEKQDIDAFRKQWKSETEADRKELRGKRQALFDEENKKLMEEAMLKSQQKLLEAQGITSGELADTTETTATKKLKSRLNGLSATTALTPLVFT